MDLKERKVIRGWPPPTTVHEVRQIIALCGFYQHSKDSNLLQPL